MAWIYATVNLEVGVLCPLHKWKEAGKLMGIPSGKFHLGYPTLILIACNLILNEISYVLYNHKGVKLAIGISVQHCRFVA